MAEPLIRVVGLTKDYVLGDNVVHALAGVSMDIAAGDFVAVMGPSGSGKSTFMNMVGCLDRPTSGSYWLAGEDVARMNADDLAAVRNRRIGFVFQQFNLLARTSALENVELPLMYANVSVSDRHTRALDKLKQVGLGDRADHQPSQLSGGQQQRVAIARALVNNPALILADEPTGALDSRTSVEIMALLQELNAGGMTIVLVTHEQDVAAFASREVHFRDGKVVSDQRQTPRSARDSLAEFDAGVDCMNALMVLRVALKALRVNKLRSSLTMLGMIIGVAAVIAMLAIGGGAQERVREQLKNLGSNLMLIFPGSTTTSGVRLGAGAAQTLTEEDALAIAVDVEGVIVAAPSVRGSGQVSAGNANWATQYFGTNNDYLIARDWPLASGRLFEPAEISSAGKVALIGQTTAMQLFGDLDPIDQVIRVRKVPLTIIGVLARKGQNALGQDQDDIVLMPLATARNRVLGQTQGRQRRINTISVKTADGVDMKGVEEKIRELLRQRMKVQPGADEPFTIRNLTEILQAQEQASRVLTLLLGAVASVSLLVGGIGIMNIMLVSVTERTREIGLRMAVGARGVDILKQFLVEAITLSMIGGALGILLGVGASFAVGEFANWRTEITASAILLAVGFSGAIGIFFGFYPARKASQLLPIEALRYE